MLKILEQNPNTNPSPHSWAGMTTFENIHELVQQLIKTKPNIAKALKRELQGQLASRVRKE